MSKYWLVGGGPAFGPRPNPFAAILTSFGQPALRGIAR
jgi:hypothetical protein